MRDARLDAARLLGELLGSPDLRARLRGVSPTDIVVVLPDDSARHLFERLHAHPKGAFVAMPVPDETEVQIARFDPSIPDDECDVIELSPESSVGMFFTLLTEFPRSYRCRLVESGRFELIDGPGPDHVPAGL